VRILVYDIQHIDKTDVDNMLRNPYRCRQYFTSKEPKPELIQQRMIYRTSITDITGSEE
jgi:hypothetical protein